MFRLNASPSVIAGKSSRTELVAKCSTNTTQQVANRRSATSVLYNVRLEHSPRRLPTRLVEKPFGCQTVGGAIGHIQRMVGVVVGEQTLATEREQTVNSTEPGVERLEVALVAAPI